MTWKRILLRGLADGATLGLLVGGVVSLALGMWVFGTVLLAFLPLTIALGEKARSSE